MHVCMYACMHVCMLHVYTIDWASTDVKDSGLSRKTKRDGGPH